MGIRKTENVRNSNIELLRVFAIIMIIGYHFVVHGYFSDRGGNQ